MLQQERRRLRTSLFAAGLRVSVVDVHGPVWRLDAARRPSKNVKENRPQRGNAQPLRQLQPPWRSPRYVVVEVRWHHLLHVPPWQRHLKATLHRQRLRDSLRLLSAPIAARNGEQPRVFLNQDPPDALGQLIQRQLLGEPSRDPEDPVDLLEVFTRILQAMQVGPPLTRLRRPRQPMAPIWQRDDGLPLLCEVGVQALLGRAHERQGTADGAPEVPERPEQQQGQAAAKRATRPQDPEAPALGREQPAREAPRELPRDLPREGADSPEVRPQELQRCQATGTRDRASERSEGSERG
mmetsp:Transcript_14590/g.43571  ORF Transcript_14590/g.43571 Transcript_14590/m.43571 type:complete len:296 (+) Transcript_14590:1021-1908(+)